MEILRSTDSHASSLLTSISVAQDVLLNSSSEGGALINMTLSIKLL